MITWHDVLFISAATAAVAVAGAAGGALLLRATATRSIRVALWVVVSTAVTVVGSAVAAVGALMLVSGHPADADGFPRVQVADGCGGIPWP